MVICVAVDDNMGMLFNNRRQSQDRMLRQHLIEITEGHKLFINSYTEKQFEVPLSENIIVDDNFMEKAEENDYCYVENILLKEYKDNINKIIIFKWNRIYPADTYFDIDLSSEGWELISTTEFEGNSHKTITKEEYIK